MSEQIRKLHMKDIVIDRNLNPRIELDKDTIEQYMGVFDDLPPVKVFDTERGLLLVDGFHRHQAAKALRRDILDVSVQPGTYREAMEYAALANLRHGKPLSSKERGRVAETMLSLHADWADNRIAKMTGCSHTTVGTTRQRLVAEGRVAKLATRIGSNGVTQSAIKAPAPEQPPDLWAGLVLEGDAFARLAEIDDASCDLIFVDPPYGILDESWDQFEGSKHLMQFTRRWLDAVVPKLKATGRLYICFSQWYIHLLWAAMRRYERDYGFIYSNTLIWNYRNAMTKANDRHEYKMAYDPILYYRGQHAPLLDFSTYGEEQGDVWTIATPQSNYHEGKVHPAQKPLPLLERIIATGCPVDGLVLDPFAGSGTTAVAAYKLGRAFRVIEHDPGYVAAIKTRLNEIAQAKEANHLMIPDGA